MLLALWPAALQLLQDNHVEMRQTVAPVVGFLGALAARPGRPAGEYDLYSTTHLETRDTMTTFAFSAHEELAKTCIFCSAHLL